LATGGSIILFAEGEMKDWKSIVTSHHQFFHGNDEYELVCGAPATEAEFEELKELLPTEVPGEMKEFYATMNGFGKSSAKYPLLWFFVPLPELPRVVREFQETIADHQSDLGNRYLPFIDWHCGDLTGYLWNREGQMVPGLWMFEHENFRYEPYQDESEFMVQSGRSIEEFLTP
jgi:hypothetical protein